MNKREFAVLLRLLQLGFALWCFAGSSLLQGLDLLQQSLERRALRSNLSLGFRHGPHTLMHMVAMGKIEFLCVLSHSRSLEGL